MMLIIIVTIIIIWCLTILPKGLVIQGLHLFLRLSPKARILPRGRVEGCVIRFFAFFMWTPGISYLIQQQSGHYPSGGQRHQSMASAILYRHLFGPLVPFPFLFFQATLQGRGGALPSVWNVISLFQHPDLELSCKISKVTFPLYMCPSISFRL